MSRQLVACVHTSYHTNSDVQVVIPQSKPRPIHPRGMAAAAGGAAAALDRPSGVLPRVLSIQSHVVSGYVGNKASDVWAGWLTFLSLTGLLHASTLCMLRLPQLAALLAACLQCAVFPLQLLGFDVDPVNSVQVVCGG